LSARTYRSGDVRNGQSYDPFWEPFEQKALEVQERTVRGDLLVRTSAIALHRREFPAEECLLGSLITHTTRTFIVGATGTGKTNLGLAIAGGIASGQGFGAWRSSRSARVLYIDGEMPLPLLQQRVRDLARRQFSDETLAELHAVSWQDADTLPLDPPAEWAPLNTPWGQEFILRLCDLIQPDVIMLDNVQCLIVGDMKDEVPWTETMPLVSALTARSIGQVWLDHTGWNNTRQYGSSTKSWSFDTVGILEPLPAADRQEGELAFSLSFDSPGKARRRTPETWRDFAPCTIRLQGDQWTVEVTAAGGAVSPGKPSPQGRVGPLVRKFHEALIDALVAPSRPANEPAGRTTLIAWEAECLRRGLIDAPEVGDTSALKARKKAMLRKAKSELLAAGWIGIDRPWVADLSNR
jgi:hypothetical protein